ncbi:helix-turn-helix transcriptional regulator [Alkaliphilus peptidifermentans]|uniref:DNA-binding transcriptional regulator, XRE-family HTH domain n=1 Tax=Alkaliphilus peptidifermentans DSM 18978 TaxID=1120976 RepID=A0A1G5J4B8_9FIRM|nr:helix-turn-helix domain-containing protein [Alkaliphilus peptidifermentans]SCY82801.1 DNA-binding transcriptional regulator, XRE-family HTH domain [Alkaliphilus peptidifermentans DSM 18978]
MDRKAFIDIIGKNIKLIRIESGYTQDEMADVLGLSKKTLVQIEKERILPSWATSVVLCTLFRHSETLHALLGGDPIELVEVIGHSKPLFPKEKTLGGRVWWGDILVEGNYRIQQNIISHHYRILDDVYRRWMSTTDIEEALSALKQLNEGKS